MQPDKQTQPSPASQIPDPAPPHFAATLPGSRRPVAGRRRKSRPRQSENWLWVIGPVIALGLTLLITIGLIFVLQADRNDDGNAVIAAAGRTVEPTSAIYGGTPAPDSTPGTEATPVGGALEGGNAMVIEPWDGEERFTVLLMGLDRRPGETNTSCTRTDTMIVISLDPVANTIGILSIPRDTYVEIPYSGLNRINTACVIGENREAGYGPVLAMQTVQYNFGIRINDYIMVDFQTFINFINRIGGIDIDVTREINDRTYPDMHYGYDPVYIPVGENTHLDGDLALKYARSRHGSDDIDRGRRQQEVMFAVRSKVLDVGMLDDVATQIFPLWNEFGEGIITGLSFDQLVQLALFARNIPEENIHNAVVTWDYLTGYRTEGGAQVAIPNRYRIGQLMLEVFGAGYNR